MLKDTFISEKPEDLKKGALHPSWLNRKIIHIDMDCFFAAVEVLDNPELKGKPVIVGGKSKRGVVCAASYEARKYGVKSAMPLFTAHKLCPTGEYLPVRMQRYQEISSQIKDIFFRYTDLVQPISMDEAFLDVSKNKKNLPYATDIAKYIRTNIKEELNLTASAGVAPNKFLAKIASDMDKPDGLYVIRPQEIISFMKKLPIRKIWGVGKVTEKKLLDLGIHLCSDLEKLPEDFLLDKFGKFGPQLLKISQGIDFSPVSPSREPKSIGNERTFSDKLTQISEAKEVIHFLCKKINKRLINKKYFYKGLQLKIKYDDFSLITRSIMLEDYEQSFESLKKAALSLIPRTELGARPVRLIGVSVHHLKEDQSKASLFELFEGN